MRPVKKPNSFGVRDDYTKESSEDGSVFSCKHCWKVFLSKCSLQEHINWHYQNSEIDKTEVENFYNDYALLRPDVDPFLSAEEDVQPDCAVAPEPLPGPSRFQVNNNTIASFLLVQLSCELTEVLRGC